MLEQGEDTIEDVTEYSTEELIADSSLNAAAGYLLADWFYRAMEKIRDARIRNGLTQSDVAVKLGTTQSVIARMENAHRGSFSVDRLLEYAWACGAAPLELEFVPPDELRRFVIERPGQVKSAHALGMWKLPKMGHERDERAEHLG